MCTFPASSPEFLGEVNWINFLVVPPPVFAAGLVKGVMMQAALGRHPLVSVLLGERIGLDAF